MLLKKLISLIKKVMIGYQGKSASAEPKLFRSDGSESDSSVLMIIAWDCISSTVFLTKSYPYIFFAFFLKIIFIFRRQCHVSVTVLPLTVQS